MKLGIMQPYFFPYIGYFQLIKACDIFVMYSDVQYIKKGWINRNRILVNGKPFYIVLPVKHDDFRKNINERYYKFIKEFENLTSVPIVINTSFNENEPIVNSPAEALNCFLKTKMDVLVLGDFIVRRK